MGERNMPGEMNTFSNRSTYGFSRKTVPHGRCCSDEASFCVVYTVLIFLCCLFQRKLIPVTKRGKVLLKKPGRTPGKGLSSLNVLLEGYISQYSVISLLDIAGVFW